MYKYNKNDNMTKKLVWSSGQYFLDHRKDLVSSPDKSTKSAFNL